MVSKLYYIFTYVDKFLTIIFNAVHTFHAVYLHVQIVYRSSYMALLFTI